ncbi:sugar O-acetyltransferase [Nostoc sp. LPT]|uniref:sugar O-acetyltransferase n=1 Tax=Nostoc sp. LPT TaxID=2815387 RepID=UPI001DB432E3|nr:sugar O-acetyltransferase [Nostoc sp. LPT]MBN4004073.1 sugar O-acetyltransferase [Nostoc sp. LPT]
MTNLQKTEKQKMLAGELYLASDRELNAERKRARRLLRLYNATTEEEPEKQLQLLQDLMGKLGSNSEIVQPFFCDYGSNIHAGNNVYIGYGGVILDCNIVELGDNLLCGPYLQIYTAYHPTDPDLRLAKRELELAAPIKIGSNVWIGGGVIICPGVTIGDNTTIGAGSIVVKDIPANVVAVGNPCRVVRLLQADSSNDTSNVNS